MGRMRLYWGEIKERVGWDEVVFRFKKKSGSCLVLPVENRKKLIISL